MFPESLHKKTRTLAGFGEWVGGKESMEDEK